MRKYELALFGLVAISFPMACTGDVRSPPRSDSNTAQTSGGSSSDLQVAGASAGTPPASAGATSGSAGSGGIGGAAGGSGFEAELELAALEANRSIGLEWDAVAGATSYRIYYSSAGPVNAQSPSFDVDGAKTTFVHRELENGTTYQYAIRVQTAAGESTLSPPVSATPSGEWVLEEFGSGIIEDLASSEPAPRVPLDQRVHVLLFAEGYLASDLGIFHDGADHEGERQGDVDDWIDEIFSIEPYTSFREAFVIWMLPRASTTHLGQGDTAFMVPTIGGDSLATGTISSSGETATRAWSAIEEHPVPPVDFSGGGFGNVRTHVAAFLLFDPNWGRAGLSGRATSLRNPSDTDQRIASAFGIGHAHEFTHAFSGLRDEYLENDNSAPQQWTEMTNVVGTNTCSELPWAHLLSGGSINPDVTELVGAFGRSELGYHPELICLMNGWHDNAEYYGGSGGLRSDRLCNWCREVTAYRVHSRLSLMADDEQGFQTWKSDYRTAFFERFPFVVPALVPQTNNPQDPSSGTPVYEGCSMTSMLEEVLTIAPPTAHGCVSED